MLARLCLDRITLYPAAPLRLATPLHARTIAREEWGSSLQWQIGEAKSAMGFASHTSDPPNAHSKGVSELLAYYVAFPVIGGLVSSGLSVVVPGKLENHAPAENRSHLPSAG
ncbi:MAG: hypothetical protein WAU53_09020, partial [Rhodoplanes sp.]